MKAELQQLTTTSAIKLADELMQVFVKRKPSIKTGAHALAINLGAALASGEWTPDEEATVMKLIQAAKRDFHSFDKSEH